MSNMTKFVQPGETLYFKASENISYMDVVPLTSTTNVAIGVGIALEPISTGSVGSVAVIGVFEFPADTTEMKFGDQVYWDKTNKKVTKTSAGNAPAGMVVEDKAASATVAKVRIG